MKLNIKDLRKATNLILDQLIEDGITEVELTKDYYWSIPAEQRYDPYVEPKELTLGQLSEDWKEILRLVDGEQEPAAYHLEWLSSLLRYIANRS
jgi:hypothetical protein